MKTTVHIDNDLVKDLKAMSRSQGTTFRASLNSLLRAGLAAKSASGRRPAPYRLPTSRMGQARINLDKALAAADEMDADEIRRKLSLRK